MTTVSDSLWRIVRGFLNRRGARRVRHLKCGGVYVLFPSEIHLQSSAGPVPEGTPLTLYMSDGGDSPLVCARPTREFEDGRFAPHPAWTEDED